MSETFKQQEILNNLLEKLLLPRILLLEQKEIAKDADLVFCNTLALNATKIIISAPAPHSRLDTRAKSKSNKDSSKSVKDRVSRPTTPSNKIYRDSFPRDNSKMRHLNDKAKKILDNSLSVISQKSTQTNIKTNKLNEYNSDKSQLNFKINDKTKGNFFPAVKGFERKQTPTNFMIRDKLIKTKSSKNFSLEKYNSRKTLYKNNNVSKTSIAEINKVNVSSLNSSALRTEQSKPKIGKCLNIIDSVSYTNTEIDLKFVKSDLDVSNLITLEQDVNDELIINQNDDKLLNNYLNEYDEKNQVSYRKLSIAKSDNKTTTISNGIDEVVDEKWNLLSRFLIKDDLITLMMISRKFYRVSICKLLANNKNDITYYNEKIKYLYEKYSEKELSSPIPEISLSKGSIKAIELLNTPIYNKLFNSQIVPNENIILPYRLYFTLIGKHEICKLKNNNKFWNECCGYFLRDNENTGDIINNSLKTLDLSDPNIYKLSRMLQNKEKFISPNYYSKSCATSGLIIFILKDIFEYLGLISDKRTIPSQLLKLNKILYNKSIEIQIKLLLLEKRFQFN